MLRRTLNIVISGLLLCFASAGCTASGGNNTSAVANDVQKYRQAVERLAPRENHLQAEYSSVTGQNYTNDQVMYKTMNKLVPAYNQFVDDVESVPTRTPQVRRVHGLMIKYVNNNSKAFTTILAALQKQDANLVTKANSYLEKARAEARAYKVAAKRLFKRYAASRG